MSLEEYAPDCLFSRWFDAPNTSVLTINSPIPDRAASGTLSPISCMPGASWGGSMWPSEPWLVGYDFMRNWDAVTPAQT